MIRSNWIFNQPKLIDLDSCEAIDIRVLDVANPSIIFHMKSGNNYIWNYPVIIKDEHNLISDSRFDFANEDVKMITKLKEECNI